MDNGTNQLRTSRQRGVYLFICCDWVANPAKALYSLVCRYGRRQTVTPSAWTKANAHRNLAAVLPSLACEHWHTTHTTHCHTRTPHYRTCTRAPASYLPCQAAAENVCRTGMALTCRRCGRSKAALTRGLRLQRGNSLASLNAMRFARHFMYTGGLRHTSATAHSGPLLVLTSRTTTCLVASFRAGYDLQDVFEIRASYHA